MALTDGTRAMPTPHLPNPSSAELVIAPLDDPLIPIEACGESHPGIVQLARGVMLVPVANVGAVPAVKVQGIVRTPATVRTSEPVALAPGEVSALVFGTFDELPSFTLELDAIAEDGTTTRTCAHFDAASHRYVSEPGPPPHEGL